MTNQEEIDLARITAEAEHFGKLQERANSDSNCLDQFDKALANDALRFKAKATTLPGDVLALVREVERLRKTIEKLADMLPDDMLD